MFSFLDSHGASCLGILGLVSETWISMHSRLKVALAIGTRLCLILLQQEELQGVISSNILILEGAMIDFTGSLGMNSGGSPSSGTSVCGTCCSKGRSRSPGGTKGWKSPKLAPFSPLGLPIGPKVVPFWGYLIEF